MKKVRKICAIVFSFVFVVAAIPVLQVDAKTNTDTLVVYITKSGEKYHTEKCSYLKKSKIEISLEDAVDAGYEPCSRCKPPVLDEKA